MIGATQAMEGLIILLDCATGPQLSAVNALPWSCVDDVGLGYVFHVRNDPMPDDCMIDDNNEYLFDANNVGGGGEGDSSGRNDFGTPSILSWC